MSTPLAGRRALVTGGSRVPPAPCYPSQFGCDGAAAVEYEYNPAKARQLLAEAGFPNGFDIELSSYVQPRQWSEAVQSYLNAVGIRARLSIVQVAAQIQRAQRGELPMSMGSSGTADRPPTAPAPATCRSTPR